MQQLLHTENIYCPYFSDLLLVFSFFIQSGESVYEPPRLKLLYDFVVHHFEDQLLYSSSKVQVYEDSDKFV